jgi:hypothetical protein
VRGVPAVISPGIGGCGVETLGWRHDREGGRGGLHERGGGARAGGLVRLGSRGDAHAVLSLFLGCLELGTRGLRLLRGNGMTLTRFVCVAKREQTHRFCKLEKFHWLTNSSANHESTGHVFFFFERRGRPASRDNLNGFYWRFLESWTTVWFFALTPHSRFVWVLLLHRDQSRLAFHLSPPKPSLNSHPSAKSFFFHPQNVFHG